MCGYGTAEGDFSYSGNQTGSWDSQLTVVKHAPVKEEQLVVFHFTSLAYVVSWVNGMAFDPSQITFRGAPGFWYIQNGQTNGVAFLIKVQTNTPFTIQPIDFQFPPMADFTDYPGWRGTSHLIQFTGFGNTNETARIKWNGKDITDTTTNAVVGQRLNLTVEVDNMNYLAAAGVTVSGYQWTVPSDAISNWVGSSSASTLTPLTSLTSSNVSFFWVDGGSKVVQCAVRLANGVTLTGKTTINVTRPNSSLSTVWVGTIGCDTNALIFGAPATGPYLHFGYGSANNTGVLFTNIPDTVVTGTYQWVQIAANAIRSEQRNNGQMRNWIGTGLDFAYPLPTSRLNSVADTPALGSPDSPPGTLLPLDANYVSATVTDAYDLYLMYNWKPAAASTDDGWVPLKRAHWGWSAGASRTGSVWSLTGSPVPPTPSISDTTNYPAWTGLAQSATWNP